MKKIIAAGIFGRWQSVFSSCLRVREPAFGNVLAFVDYVPFLGLADSAWVGLGRVNLILDNLIADGKISPLLVVMPFGSIVSFQLSIPVLDQPPLNIITGTLSFS
mgnify:CR=1 FL=1